MGDPRLELLLEELRASRTEIGRASSDNAAAARTGVVALAAAVGALALQTQQVEGNPIFSELLVVGIGILLLFAILACLWMLSDFAFIMARAYFEAFHLRKVAASLVGDGAFVNWDSFDHRLKRNWLVLRAFSAYMLIILVIVFHVAYLWLFVVKFDSSQHINVDMFFVFLSIGVLNLSIDAVVVGLGIWLQICVHRSFNIAATISAT